MTSASAMAGRAPASDDEYCRGVLARALAEHEQVAERVAAEPVRAVHAAADLAGGEKAWHR